MVGATLFRFQEDAITDIFDIFNKPNSKQTLLNVFKTLLSTGVVAE